MDAPNNTMTAGMDESNPPIINVNNAHEAKAETPKMAARRLMDSSINKGYKPVALHEYQRADGKPSHYVIRLKNEVGDKIIRPMQRVGEAWELSAPPSPRPLYRLPDIINAPTEAIIFIVEGEQKADELIKLGLIATCSMGGAGNAKHSDWQPLAGRRVRLWGDNDEAGAGYCADVAGILSPMKCNISLINVGLLGLPEKGDAVNWLAMHPKATADDVMALALIEAPSPPTPTNPQNDDEAEIARLAKLSPLDYEREREAAAKAMGCRTATLDKLVKAAKPSDGNGGGGAINIPITNAWGKPVDGGELLAEIESLLSRFVYLPNGANTAAALWIMFTYCIDYAVFAPFLFIHSPEKRCGKSTLMKILKRLVYRPLPASNISPAAVFRVIENCQPTLLIDEADSFLKDNEPMRNVLNSGHSRDSAYVIRVEGESLEPRQFSTWGAKALAAIGRIADTLADRAIIIKMKRKGKADKIDDLKSAMVDFETIRQKCVRWVNDNGALIKRTNPSPPNGLNDRAADNWSCLFSIAQVIGDDWLVKAQKTAVSMDGEEDSESLKTCLLTDIKEIFDNEVHDYMTTKELIEKLAEDEEKVWRTFDHGRTMTPKQLAHQLRPFGIKSKTKKIGYGVGSKSYFKNDFEDAFIRYLPNPSGEGENLPLPVTNLLPVGYDGNGNDFQKVHPLPLNHCESKEVTGNGSFTLPSTHKREVTDKNTENHQDGGWIRGEI